MQLDVIMIRQDNVGKRQRYVTGRQKFFFARRKAHRGAGVYEDIRKQVDFFAEDSNVQPVGASVDTPVEIAKIVAGRIFAVVGKLQTGAAARRRVTAGMTAEELFSRAQPQGFQLSEKLRRERIGQHDS